MASESTIYTMGQALNRALADNSTVDVLVDGQWLSGAVVVSDGYGVVLDNGDEHSIVKVEKISAVRILAGAPRHGRLTEGNEAGAPFAEAMPMPGPRMARVS